MAWVAVIAGGAAIAGSIYSSDKQRKAGHEAADAQKGTADAGIGEQRRQFDAIQKLLAPYVTAGTGALTGQQNLIGLNGFGAQADAIDALKLSPAFTSAQKAGEDSILAHAAATGGLRGGNVQSALGQFSPQLLSALINDQYTKLGGISSQGLGAATMTGNAGLNTSNQVTQLLQQQGAATAGGAIAAGRAGATLGSGVIGGIGTLLGAGFRGFGTPAGGAAGQNPYGLNSSPAYDPYGLTPRTTWQQGSGDGFVTMPGYGF